MTSSTISPAERVQRVVILRRAIAWHARTLSTLLAGLADAYASHFHERDLIAYIGRRAERVRHALAVLVVAERQLAEAF